MQEENKCLKSGKQVPLKMPVSGRHIERCLTGSSLRLFNLLYCKYLIPPRCLLAISGRINRRRARQKGQNEYLRLSDVPLPAFSLHLDVAGLTHKAMLTRTIDSSKVFKGNLWLISLLKKTMLLFLVSNII